MPFSFDLWSAVVILLSAFIIGWGAEAAQTFLPRALALTILAWLQTLPEFAVEANIAWHQERDLMIANLTGSLRLIVGLGWPMIFFVHWFFAGIRKNKKIRVLNLGLEDVLSVRFLFISVLYFLVILYKRTLTVVDSGLLILIYGVYLWCSSRQPVSAVEEEEELPWVAKRVIRLGPRLKVWGVAVLFLLGGAGLYFSVDPFVHALQRWALSFGISTFVFVQWVAPFLSEFPEKVTAFNWARQESKASMAIMNMVSSNINQWTMLAAMVPVVFSISLGHAEAVTLNALHRDELALTLAQSILGGLLLLDLQFGFWEAVVMLSLWLIQFIFSDLRLEITLAYAAWSLFQIARYLWNYARERQIPKALCREKR